MVAGHESRVASLHQITKELLQAYGRFPRKNLGQHFLVDPKVVERIIAAASLTNDDLVVEIGSGLGVVTSEIAKHVNHLAAIEIDKELVGISKEVLASFTNVTFVPEDILKVELEKVTLGRKYKVIGNLPYYITAPIVEKILTAKEKPVVAVIMVQKEVAERMAATPGTKKFGSFSIFTQFYAKVELNSFVSKSSFLPWPEVGSAIVSLIPHTSSPFPGLDEKLFFDIVHAAFQQRRKKLRNSLAEYNLEKVSLDLNRRPETLGLEQFVQLANQLSD
jgi:16S rRNA (adenine1518-N6/adenine1519-N6)-dimethyltransferase